MILSRTTSHCLSAQLPLLLFTVTVSLSLFSPQISIHLFSLAIMPIFSIHSFFFRLLALCSFTSSPSPSPHPFLPFFFSSFSAFIFPVLCHCVQLRPAMSYVHICTTGAAVLQGGRHKQHPPGNKVSVSTDAKTLVLKGGQRSC